MHPLSLLYFIHFLKLSIQFSVYFLSLFDAPPRVIQALAVFVPVLAILPSCHIISHQFYTVKLNHFYFLVYFCLCVVLGAFWYNTVRDSNLLFVILVTIEDTIAAILFVWMWIRRLATGPISTQEKGFGEGRVEGREPSGEHRAGYMNLIERGEGVGGGNHNANIHVEADDGEGASGGGYGDIDEDLQPQQERRDQQIPLEFGFQPRTATPVPLPEPSELHPAYRQRTFMAYGAHRAAILEPVVENREENSGVSPANLQPQFEPRVTDVLGHSGTTIETDL